MNFLELLRLRIRRRRINRQIDLSLFSLDRTLAEIRLRVIELEAKR